MPICSLSKRSLLPSLTVLQKQNGWFLELVWLWSIAKKQPNKKWALEKKCSPTRTRHRRMIPWLVGVSALKRAIAHSGSHKKVGLWERPFGTKMSGPWLCWQPSKDLRCLGKCQRQDGVCLAACARRTLFFKQFWSFKSLKSINFELLGLGFSGLCLVIILS